MRVCVHLLRFHHVLPRGECTITLRPGAPSFSTQVALCSQMLSGGTWRSSCPGPVVREGSARPLPLLLSTCEVARWAAAGPGGSAQGPHLGAQAALRCAGSLLGLHPEVELVTESQSCPPVNTLFMSSYVP